MNSIHKPQIHAFTVLELFIVVAVMLILATVILPALRSPGCGGHRLNCVNNQKQIGLAFKTWAIDNQDRFPMEVSTNAGGTMELTNGPYAFAHFQVMSNELSTPRLLLCPQETKRTMATNFAVALSNTNISYFVGLDATVTNASAFLCGDRTLINGLRLVANVLTVATNRPIGWTFELHKTETRARKALGVLCLGDGSVQSLDNVGLNLALQNSGITNRLAMP